MDSHIGYRHHKNVVKAGECPSCHYGGTKQNKIDHMKSQHDGRAKLFCDLCEHSPFARQKNLDEHLLKMHCPKCKYCSERIPPKIMVEHQEHCTRFAKAHNKRVISKSNLKTIN